MVYRVGICDDEKLDRKRAEALLETYQRMQPECRQFVVYSYPSVDAMLFELPDHPPFDLLLLDIYMPGKTGIEGALELRSRGFEGPIVFLTTSREHALEAFDVNAAHYLLKPVEETRFFAVLEKVLGKVNEERRRFLTLRAEREVRRVALRNIIYCESQNHYKTLYLADGEELRVRMTLAELYDALCEFPDFVRVGNTYIVNLGYVDSLNAKVMRLTSGKEIWLPRGCFNELRAQYFDFYQNG